MKEYKRFTSKIKIGNQTGNILECSNCSKKEICKNEVNYKNTCLRATIDRLAELEDKIEQGELVSVKAIAKLLDFMFNDYPCNYIFDTLEVSKYMVEKYGDWCEENCSKHGQDCTPCWEMFLKAQLKELKNEQ